MFKNTEPIDCSSRLINVEALGYKSLPLCWGGEADGGRERGMKKRHGRGGQQAAVPLGHTWWLACLTCKGRAFPWSILSGHTPSLQGDSFYVGFCGRQNAGDGAQGTGIFTLLSARPLNSTLSHLRRECSAAWFDIRRKQKMEGTQVSLYVATSGEQGTSSGWTQRAGTTPWSWVPMAPCAGDEDFWSRWTEFRALLWHHTCYLTFYSPQFPWWPRKEKRKSYLCCRINEASYTLCYWSPLSARSSSLFNNLSTHCTCLKVCICTVYMQCLWSLGHWIHGSWSYRWLWVILSMLRTEPRSSAEATSALNLLSHLCGHILSACIHVHVYVCLHVGRLVMPGVFLNC